MLNPDIKEKIRIKEQKTCAKTVNIYAKSFNVTLCEKCQGGLEGEFEIDRICQGVGTTYAWMGAFSSTWKPSRSIAGRFPGAGNLLAVLQDVFELMIYKITSP